MRIESPRRAKNGGWLHTVSGERLAAAPVVPTHVIHDRAPVAHLDAIYSTLIRGHLVLSHEHRDSLIARGLSLQAVEHNGYRSTPGPTFAKNVARYLSFYDLTGVPGFYRQADEWLIVNPGQGILIPVRDSRMRIRGFQVRRDEGSPRYIWFSSSSKPHGASSGAPIHFSKSHLIREQGKAIITEGCLKADIIAHKLQTGVIGLPGVSSFPPHFAANLRRRFDTLTSISVAFDSDFQTNDQVKSNLFRLVNDLRLAGLRVSLWTWADAKGLDDLLAA